MSVFHSFIEVSTRFDLGFGSGLQVNSPKESSFVKSKLVSKWVRTKNLHLRYALRRKSNYC